MTTIETWLATKDMPPSTEQPSSIYDLHLSEQSLAAQAAHHHGETGYRFQDLKDLVTNVLVTNVLKLAYPQGASTAEKRIFIKNRRDELNRDVRNPRFEDNLAKHVHKDDAVLFFETPDEQPHLCGPSCSSNPRLGE